MKLKYILSIALVGFVSAIAAVGLYRTFGEDKSSTVFIEGTNPFSNASITEETKSASNTVAFDFTKAADKGLPAVVHIRSTVPGQKRGVSFEDIFRDNPFGRRDGSAQPQQGFGSGVIIHPDGFIVTNNHVIEDATEISVATSNNMVFEAELIGTDPTTDIALIKIDEDKLPYLSFADSEELKVGQWVAAIGNPAVGTDAYTLKSTVTAGIISAKGRNIRINDDIDLAIESFIQTDAVINRGNSGGALVDTNGDLIGINTAISTPTGVYAGYGFAVPSNLVRKVITDLKEHGKVQRALLGISFNDIEDIKSRGGEVESKEKEGKYIAEVVPGGAAEEAGLRRGDVIIKLDGKQVTDGQYSVQEIIGLKRPGEEVEVVYRRDGQTKTKRVKLLSPEKTSANYVSSAGVEYFDDLGVKLGNLTDREKERMNSKSGVKVVELDRDGLLNKRSYGEIDQGFVITRVNNEPVNSVKDVKNALKQSSSAKMIKIDGSNPGENVVRSFTFGIE